jgi:hypothetical protein
MLYPIKHTNSCTKAHHKDRIQKKPPKQASVVKQAVPQLWGTSNATFNTDKVGEIKISFVEYSASIRVCIQPDIVENEPGEQPPMYVLIIGK